MIVGGTVTITLIISGVGLPYQLDANVFGLSSSAIIYALVHWTLSARSRQLMPDRVN